MLESNYDFNIPSGAPVVQSSAGRKVKLLGSTDAPKGSVVIAGFDDSDDLLDAGIAIGVNSPVTRCQIPIAGDATVYGDYGIFGIVKSDPHIAGEEGFIAVGNELVEANVQVAASTTLDAWTPLMVDFADANLELADGTTKCIAVLATKVVNSTGSPVVASALVYVSGTYGFGSAS